MARKKSRKLTDQQQLIVGTLFGEDVTHPVREWLEELERVQDTKTYKRFTRGLEHCPINAAYNFLFVVGELQDNINDIEEKTGQGPIRYG